MKQLTQKNKRRLDNVKHEVLPSLAGNRQPKRVKYHPDSRGYGHLKDTSAEFCIEPSNRPDDKESDPMRLQQRQKQVDYGKNTLGYERYLSSVPKEKRVRGVHFWTPNIHRKCSKRAFAGQIRVWRRELHKWDPPKEDGDDDPECTLQDLSEILADCENLEVENTAFDQPIKSPDAVLLAGAKEKSWKTQENVVVSLESEFEDLNDLLDLYEQLGEEGI